MPAGATVCGVLSRWEVPHGGNLTIRNAVVLRGAGRDRTTMFFTKSWSDITGKWGRWMWSFGPGLLVFYGRDSAAGKAAQLAADAARGDRHLLLSSTAGLRHLLGKWVRITARDPGKRGDTVGRNATPLAYYLLGKAGMDTNTSDLMWPVKCTTPRNLLNLLVRVTNVTGNRVTLDRRLPVALSTRWRDVLVREVTTMGMKGQPVMGIEHLTVEMPSNTQYPGHFDEKGYNAVNFINTANCFARNIRVSNADNSLTCQDCFQCTFMNILVEANRKSTTAGTYGHHGIWLAGGGNNLVTDFNIRAPQEHDLSVDSHTALNVFRSGMGRDINIDFHRLAPHSNLFTNIDLGLGKRPFFSGGEMRRGPHAAIYNTIWRIRASKRRPRLNLPCDYDFHDRRDKDRCTDPRGHGMFGPNLTIVGSNMDTKTKVSGWCVEDIPTNRPVPTDLYTAQVQKRWGRVAYTSP